MASELIGLDARGVSKIFPFSIRTWRRMDSSGKCPRGYRVGQKKIWNYSTLKMWAELGYPTRADFENRAAVQHD
jgi:hypothetical protein